MPAGSGGGVWVWGGGDSHWSYHSGDAAGGYGCTASLFGDAERPQAEQVPIQDCFMTPLAISLLSDQEAAQMHGGYACVSSVMQNNVAQRRMIRSSRCGTANPDSLMIRGLRKGVKAAAAAATAALTPLCEKPWVG